MWHLTVFLSQPKGPFLFPDISEFYLVCGLIVVKALPEQQARDAVKREEAITVAFLPAIPDEAVLCHDALVWPGIVSINCDKLSIGSPARHGRV